MSDTALKPTVANPGWQPRNRGENGIKILELGAPGSGSPDSRLAGAPQRDWSSALDLIQEASEAIRLSEERSADLEAELREISAKSAETTRQLEGQLATVERRLAKMEERARAAEARANDSEAWLVRVNDSLVAAFGQRRDFVDEGVAIDPPAAEFETAAE
jgi:predicted  nucleic acid-binding Zn-ribbon protein